MDAAIKGLSLAEKIALVEELCEEIDKERGHQLSDAQRKFTRERVQKHENSPVPGKNWDELREKYKLDNIEMKNQILPSQMELLIDRRDNHEANPLEGISLDEFITKYNLK